MVRLIFGEEHVSGQNVGEGYVREEEECVEPR